MKTALVLGGGGSKGAYEIGVWKALKELGQTFDIVTGTSIGALIGAMVVQDDYEKCYELWKDLSVDQVIASGVNLDLDIELLMSQKDHYKTLLGSYFNNKGADISPFIIMITKMLDSDKFFNSTIDYGCMCVNISKMSPAPKLKKDMTKENLADFLLASASCFPAFPLKKIEDDYYVDGGYYDNVPINLAKSMGAEKVIAVDLKSVGRNVVKTPQKNLIYIEPMVPLGSFLMFDAELIKRNIQIGYQDAMKKFKKYLGYVYTFYLVDKNIILSFEKSFANFLKELAFSIRQPHINRLYQNVFNHQLKGTMKPYEMTKYKYLRILESCDFVFAMDYVKVYEFKSYIDELISLVNAYNPTYDVLFEKGLTMKQIGKELMKFSQKDIIYYFYRHLNKKQDDENQMLQYLAILSMDEFMMALVLHYVYQEIVQEQKG